MLVLHLHIVQLGQHIAKHGVIIVAAQQEKRNESVKMKQERVYQNLIRSKMKVISSPLSTSGWRGNKNEQEVTVLNTLLERCGGFQILARGQVFVHTWLQKER